MAAWFRDVPLHAVALAAILPIDPSKFENVSGWAAFAALATAVLIAFFRGDIVPRPLHDRVVKRADTYWSDVERNTRELRRLARSNERLGRIVVASLARLPEIDRAAIYDRLGPLDDDPDA